MKKETKKNLDIKALQSSWNVLKKALEEYQTTLLQADIAESVEFWLQKARASFEDRGSISNYHAYIKDLLRQGILCNSVSNPSYLRVIELNDFHEAIIERINECPTYNLNDRRYRIKALLAFIKFLNEETEGKVIKFSAPPSLMPVNDRLPKLVDYEAKPKVLTEEEFLRLCDAIKNPKQRDLSNFRDYIVLEIMYQTGRPLLDILGMQKKNIQLDKKTIGFNNSNQIVQVPINEKLAQSLDAYLSTSEKNRKDETAFITREGNPIFRTHFYQVLKHASAITNLGFTATFKMIQWAYVAKRMQADQSREKIMNELKLKKVPKNIEA